MAEKLNEILVDGKITKEQKDSLLDFARVHSDSIDLMRDVNWKIDEDILVKINEEYVDYAKKGDRERRERFLKDEGYRQELLDDLGSEEEVMDYFDGLFDQELEVVEEVDEDDDDFYFYDEEDGEMDLLDLSEEELQGIEFIEDEEEEFALDEYALYDVLEYSDEYYEKEGFETKKPDLLGKHYSRFSHSSMGSIYEISRFSPDRVHKELKDQLISLYSYPFMIDEYLFLDPCYLQGERGVLSICSHESFARLSLTDEEFSEFKKLGIPYLEAGDS